MPSQRCASWPLRFTETGHRATHPGASPGQPRCQVVRGPGPTVPSLSGPQAPGLEVERGRLTSLGLPPAVLSTIQCARASSMAMAYGTPLALCCLVCEDRALDPSGCSVNVVLEFLQGHLVISHATSTLAVFVAAILIGHEGAFQHVATPGLSVFFRGARRVSLPPPPPPSPP